LAYDRKQGGHSVAQANRPDYRLEIGRAEVPVGEPRGFSVLDAPRATTLRAWVATLIPARGARPDAAEVGAAEYVDATVFLVPALRPALMQAIDRIERSPIDRLIVTNTIPQSTASAACSKIVVLSVARLLGQAIKSIHEETSVSSLFV